MASKFAKSLEDSGKDLAGFFNSFDGAELKTALKDLEGEGDGSVISSFYLASLNTSFLSKSISELLSDLESSKDEARQSTVFSLVSLKSEIESQEALIEALLDEGLSSDKSQARARGALLFSHEILEKMSALLTTIRTRAVISSQSAPKISSRLEEIVQLNDKLIQECGLKEAQVRGVSEHLGI